MSTLNLRFRKMAPNTYEVSDARGPVGVVQRDPGGSSWSGYDRAGAIVVDGYPGSRAVAAANLACHVRSDVPGLLDQLSATENATSKYRKLLACARDLELEYEIDRLSVTVDEYTAEGDDLRDQLLAAGYTPE